MGLFFPWSASSLPVAVVVVAAEAAELAEAEDEVLKGIGIAASPGIVLVLVLLSYKFI